ncbi:MAG: YchJ family protein [Spirochaetaceae bacterium]|jgi:SEC-C motif-containing protein|nr:YchJ family protein [Spirochaetaceae bacterium]
MKLCPCGSGASYSECCEPYITGVKQLSTAETLMRSRYSAYVEHAIDYIVDTCIRKEGNQDIDIQQTKSWSEKSQWLGLNVLSVSQGGPEDTEGSVEFEAVYEYEGLKDIHHEKAKFKKQNGKWLYDEGEIVPKTIVRSAPKVGRNDLCPCGSGKKYKRCHGKT